MYVCSCIRLLLVHHVMYGFDVLSIETELLSSATFNRPTNRKQVLKLEQNRATTYRHDRHVPPAHVALPPPSMEPTQPITELYKSKVWVLQLNQPKHVLVSITEMRGASAGLPSSQDQIGTVYTGGQELPGSASLIH